MKKQSPPLDVIAFLLATSAVAQPLYDEPYRPQYHFSLAMHFMNDPNGLVYFKGVWHLYYQYNPLQIDVLHFLGRLIERVDRDQSAAWHAIFDR
jgi:Glycosyl hydrolases family 32 N-terminal domain